MALGYRTDVGVPGPLERLRPGHHRETTVDRASAVRGGCWPPGLCGAGHQSQGGTVHGRPGIDVRPHPRALAAGQQIGREVGLADAHGPREPDGGQFMGVDEPVYRERRDSQRRGGSRACLVAQAGLDAESPRKGPAHRAVSRRDATIR
jgi:hypothetical protein